MKPNFRNTGVPIPGFDQMLFTSTCKDLSIGDVVFARIPDRSEMSYRIYLVRISVVHRSEEVLKPVLGNGRLIGYDGCWGVPDEYDGSRPKWDDLLAFSDKWRFEIL